jgi:uncharacterized UPF0160 family protein
MSEWKYKIDLGRSFDPDVDDFSEHRDRAVAVIRNSRWAKRSSSSWVLVDYLDEMADAEDIETFDIVMDAIYDLADEDLCWIETKL